MQAVVKKYNTWWLSESLLLQKAPALDDVYLRVTARPRYKASVAPSLQNRNVLPDTGKSWRFARMNGTWYYAYNNLPENLRMAIPENELTQSPFLADSSFIDELRRYIDQESGRYMMYYAGTHQQQSLSKAAAVLGYAVRYIKSTAYDVRKSEFFELILDAVEKLEIKHLPTHVRNLKARVLEVIQGVAINDIVRLKRVGNSNALKYDDPEVVAWIYQLRSHPRNFTNAHIIRQVNELCGLHGKPAPSNRWLGSLMEQPLSRYLTVNRYGDLHRNSYYQRNQIPLAGAMHAGDAWQIDATRVNIASFKGEGKSRHFVIVTTVRDVCSGDILGYSFGLSENRWSYYVALKMAVENAGYLPYELIYDRFPGHNSEEIKTLFAALKAFGVRLNKTSKSTGKQQLERCFGSLQTVFMNQSDYYYGEGIKSKRAAAHRSPDYVIKLFNLKKEDWNFDAACNESTRIIEAYRNTKLCTYSRKHKNVEASPNQLHQQMEKPDIIDATPERMAYIFGLKKKLKHISGLFKTEINKVTFYYRSSDYNFISRYSEAIVCYNPDDLSYVHLYEVSNKPLKKHLGIALEEIPAYNFGPAAQWDKIQKVQAIVRELEAMRAEELQLKKAAGDDITPMLAPARMNKVYVEQAETTATVALLSGNNRNSSENGGDEPFDFDVRNQY
jgi:hypothetical protein